MDIRTLTEDPTQQIPSTTSATGTNIPQSRQMEHTQPELVPNNESYVNATPQPRPTSTSSTGNDNTSNQGTTQSPSPLPQVQSTQSTHTNTDENISSYNYDHDAHNLNKPKRQRRSYSCGPCKMLKIKCDLQIPCTSCKKFKRVNRCLLQPPQPPSQEELSKIKERKKRTMHKRLKTSNDIVHAFHDDQNSIPSLLSSINSSSKLMDQHQRSFLDQSVQAQRGNNDNYASTLTRQSQYSNLQPETNNETPAHPITHITSNFDDQVQPRLFTENQKPQGDLLNTLLYQDYQKIVELSMVDVKRIKRLLPSKFEAIERLYQLYINTINSVFLDTQDHDEIMRVGRLVYEKLVSIDDENVRNLSKSIEFNVVELRNLSLMFLILASGFLFENMENVSCNFLFDLRTIYKADLIEDWVKIAKFIKLRLLSYESLTDLIYLMDWYLIIKNLYTYDNQIIENYLEFNSLLNYLVLNNGFIELMEDTGGETTVNDGTPQPQGDDETGRRSYPTSREFRVLGKYWIQLRMIDLEFTFFQYKGSMLVSNQLKNSIVPHKDVLESMYGPKGELANSSLTKHQVAVWSLYYTRSGQSTSIRRIVQDYLELYSNASFLLKDDLAEVETKFCKTGEQTAVPQVTIQDVELLLKNQQILLLFVRWLSFIRIESNYFPSLRYSSFLTTMMNLNNHFNLLDKYYKAENSGENLVDYILRNFSLHFIKAFFQCLTYQSLFLIFLKYALVRYSKRATFKIRLDEVYPHVLNSFQTTLSKFITSPKIKEYHTHIAQFVVNINFLIDANHILNEETTEFERQGKDSTTQHKPLLEFQNLADLLRQLKQEFDPGQWEFITDVYFGSRDNFFRYVEKEWDLFQFLLSSDATPGDGPGAHLTKDMVITNRLRFNDEFVNFHKGKLMGLVFDNNDVREYMKLNVEPNIDD
ncbi:hypothetical protein KGF57_002696 [Candida theae]|uniref:Zn(2)-C6 fungal-type domain-containing protein n=1 Tax=Candida theae TaxID=1198502 RepID=A0AAD5BF39_9ASCO|nr:uncharacterized protein KGF57_002696 [Candida theae]KAI5958340.1 hypothetical protein KGF57_002696 [Candida theae]